MGRCHKRAKDERWKQRWRDVGVRHENEFKIKEISVGYGSDGSPAGINICYWIGEKRLEGDEYCNNGFGIEGAGSGIVVTPDDDEGTRAIMGGRDVFLRYIDQSYEMDCIDGQSRKRMC